ncbi:MAG: hypothetical protein Q9213_000107 [Squamulea squamosa]
MLHGPLSPQTENLPNNSKTTLNEPTSLQTKTIIYRPSKPIYDKSPTPLNESTSTKAKTIFDVKIKAHFLDTIKTTALNSRPHVPNEPRFKNACNAPFNESASPTTKAIFRIENQPLLHFINFEAPAPHPFLP